MGGDADDTHEHDHEGRMDDNDHRNHDHGNRDHTDLDHATHDQGTHDHSGGHDGNAGQDHHHHDLEEVAVAVVTVSSSRTLETDSAGDAIEAVVRDHDGAHVASRDLVPDDREALGDAIDAGVEAADVVVTAGGTGITPDDVTVEVARERFEKELPGFGELFRRRSEPDIGDRVMATRATAGVVDRTPVFCLPGSENAARLGAELVTSQAAHLAGLASR